MDMTTGTTTRPVTDAPEARYDVVVVGGGAAGLSAALSLARARRSVLVIDDGSPRNAPAGHVHNYLGREGTPPRELLAIGRREVAGYGGEVVADRVTGIARLGAGDFRVARRDGRPVEARRLLVTTGLVDDLPPIAGLADRWGTDVLHCPYCHGWEVRDQAVVVLGTGPLAAHQALLWRQWTPSLTLVLHDAAAAPSDEAAERLAAVDVAVVAGPVAAVEVAGDHVTGVRLDSGRVVACQAMVVAPRFDARAEFLTRLGLPTADFLVGDFAVGTHVPADATGAINVAGVWVAGNVVDPGAQVIGAAAAGGRVAHAINLDLVTEDADAAVLARRDPFSARSERQVGDLIQGDRRHGP